MQRTRHLAVAFALPLILALCPRCDAMFFKLKQGQLRCFIELFRKNEVVIVNYKSPDQANLPREPERVPYHAGPKILVKESSGGAVFEGRSDKEGRFAFTARNDMEHSLCWRCASSNALPHLLSSPICLCLIFVLAVAEL